MKKYFKPDLDISILSLDEVICLSGISVEDENNFDGNTGENV